MRVPRPCLPPSASRLRRPPAALRAQALVELAVILPVLLIIVLGTIDLGRAFMFGVTVQDATREAARLGAKAALDSSVTDTVILQRLIDASGTVLSGCTAVTTTQTCGGSTWTLSVAYHTSKTSGQLVEVKAVGSVSLLAGFRTGAFNLGLSSITVQGDSWMPLL